VITSDDSKNAEAKVSAFFVKSRLTFVLFRMSDFRPKVFLFSLASSRVDTRQPMHEKRFLITMIPSLISSPHKSGARSVGSFLLAACIALLLGAEFTACNDAPTEVGSAVIPDTVNARSVSSLDTTILLSSGTVVTRGVVYNSGVLYIGASRTTRAATVIRMTTIPDYLASLTTQNIDSAYLLIRPTRFVYGDSSVQANKLQFGVYELNKAFITADTAGSIGVSVRWPDLFSSGLTPNPAYFAGDTIASYSGVIPLADTLSDIKIPLNAIGRQMVASWFVKQADSAKRSTIYGLGFVPYAGSTVVRAFTTASVLSPTLPLIRLRVFYHDSTKADSLTIQSGNDCSVVDSDTIAAPLSLLQSLVQSEQRLVYDVSSIPVTDAILKAQLTLTMDTTYTTLGNINTANKLSIISRFDKDSANPVFGTSFTSGKTAGSDKVVFANVSQALDQARRSYGGKGGFSVVSNGNALERYAIYGLDAPRAMRPTLVITYAPRPTAGGKR
jgi:hypothetical protein